MKMEGPTTLDHASPGQAIENDCMNSHIAKYLLSVFSRQGVFFLERENTPQHQEFGPLDFDSPLSP